jgi:hypothetical protein
MLPKLLDEVVDVLQRFFIRRSDMPTASESGCPGLYRIYSAMGLFTARSEAFVVALSMNRRAAAISEAANRYAELVEALAKLLSELERHADGLEIYDPGISAQFREIFGMKSQRVSFWLAAFKSNGALLKTDRRLRLLDEVSDSHYWSRGRDDIESYLLDAQTVSLDDAETVARLTKDAEDLTAKFKMVQREFAEFIKCHCRYADLFVTKPPGGSEHRRVQRASQIAPRGDLQESKIVSGLKIFLCHASGDKEEVRKLFRSLSDDGFAPWLDEECLIAGQDWDAEIRKAVKESHVVIVCLSAASTTKAGYVQKEIRLALDVSDEQPEGTIFVIPLRLEDCVVPERLSKWHWVDIFAPNGYRQLARALGARSAMLQMRAN